MTDDQGAEFLVELLKLPYAKVSTQLNALQDLAPYQPHIWSFGKVYAYTLQQEPFLHLDGDVFLWKPFPDDMLRQPIVVQQLENQNQFHESVFSDVRGSLGEFPPYEQGAYSSILSQYNMGVFGGSDLAHIHTYAQDSMAFVRNNLIRLSTLQNPNAFSTFFEQHLLTQYLRAQGVSPYCLLPTKPSKEDDFTDLARFDDFPATAFVHLMGFYKRQYAYCEFMTQRLSYEFPEQFKRINTINNLTYYKR